MVLETQRGREMTRNACLSSPKGSRNERDTTTLSDAILEPRWRQDPNGGGSPPYFLSRVECLRAFETVCCATQAPDGNHKNSKGKLWFWKPRGTER